MCGDLTDTLCLGESLGWGGELVTAQFLPTKLVDTKTLRPSSNELLSDRMGLFIDVRCREGAKLMTRIMETGKIVKLIWGADADTVCLRYQCHLKAAAGKYDKIKFQNVIDVQLGFSTIGQRLGMQKALDRFATSHEVLKLSKGLPRNFYDPVCYNKRVCTLPLSKELALYSVDDLHRIEAILEKAKPHSGSYHAAKVATNHVAASQLGWDVEWFQREANYYRRAFGSKKRQKAVQLARAGKHMELAFGSPSTPSAKRTVQSVMDMVEPVLKQSGVVIPSDLSFAD